MMKNDEVVGHVPRKILVACTLFIKKRGIIDCIVTGRRRYSCDLPRGGLEVPCVYRFHGNSELVSKIKRLLVSKSSSVDENVPECTSSKRRKTDNSNTSLTPDSVWKVLNGYELSQADKLTILSGGRLNDKHINFAHQILKKQFPNLTGLQSTLLLSRSQQMPTTTTSPYLQIIHTNGNHWIVASTIGCSPKFEFTTPSIHHCRTRHWS